MPKVHPTLATYEEFCKYYEQESDIGKRRLFRAHEIATKAIERKREQDRRRYYRQKEEHHQEPAPAPVPAPAPETKVLAAIPEEEVVPVKVKRNSFTIPRPDMVELMLRSPSPARTTYPQVISNTKTMREIKRPPPA